jgi:hypothetical protein
MRRPIGTAAAESAAVIRAAIGTGDYRTVGGLTARLPRALLRRRAPDPAVEAALALLAEGENGAGYSPDAPPRPGADHGSFSRIGDG